MPRTRSPLTRHVLAIRRALTAIDRSLGRLVALSRTHGAGSKGNARRRKLRLSPQRLAQLKVQGQYIGLIRNLKPAHKAKVKATRAAKGMRAAIAVAKRLAG